MHRVKINHEIIMYEEFGSGTPLICIHPPGMGRKVFYEQKVLSNNIRLILPDLIGQGDSSYIGGSDISVKRFSEDIIALMDHIQLSSAVIFGYSAGGIIAQYLSIHYRSRVQALIMSGAYPVVNHFILKNQHRLGIYAVEKSKTLLAKVIAMSHTKDRNYRAILKEHLLKSNSSVWSKYYRESMLFNCMEEIKGLDLPVLLMYGSKSDAMNMYIPFYKEYLSNKEIHVIKGASHQLPTREPEAVNNIIMSYLHKL